MPPGGEQQQRGCRARAASNGLARRPSLGSDSAHPLTGSGSGASALQQAGAELAALLGLGAEQGPGRGVSPAPTPLVPLCPGFLGRGSC